MQATINQHNAVACCQVDLNTLLHKLGGAVSGDCLGTDRWMLQVALVRAGSAAAGSSSAASQAATA
jgi:hypothetical protein